MVTKAEFNKMNMEQMKAHVEKAEREVNTINKMVMKYADENDIDANVIAAALMGMIGRMISVTAGHDVAKQDEYLETVKHGIVISMAENGYRPFPDDVLMPPWLRN